MSFLGSIGHGLKKIGHAVGGVAEKAAPFVGLIPGVGTLAGGAIGGLGALAHGDGLGGALKYGALGATSGLANSKLLGGGGLKAIGSKLGIGGHSGGGYDINNPADNIFAGSASGGGGGGLLSSLGGIGSGLLGGLKKVGIDNILGGGALGYGAYQQKQAGDMRDKALKLITDDYATRAPLRTQGLQGMLNETPPDLSSIYSDPQNPFSRKRVA